MKYKFFMIIMIVFFAFTVNAVGEATIKNIKVNGTACTCTGFDCAVEITGDSAKITYDLVDKDAKVDRLSGFSIDLLSEVTNIKLNVTNDTGETKISNTYNLSITKLEKKVNLKLKSLKVNGNSIKLADEVVVYSQSCKYDAEKVTIEAAAADANAKVVYEKTYNFPLDEGSLAIDFYVENGGKRQDYRVMMSRDEKPNTVLKTLVIEEEKIDFDPTKLEYEFNVEYTINELHIKAEAENKEAKVDIDNKNLVVGENEITIKVTNGQNESVYLLKVTREENIDKSIANLKSIKIDEYSKLSFDENVLDYTLNFSSVPEKLTIKAISKDTNSKITITGNEKLKDGSKITIKNKLNESKVTREYTLLIKESHGMSDNKTVILGSIIGLSIVIIVLLFLDIHSKKREKKRYLKKIFDLRHKVERKRKEEKEKKVKEEKERKIKLRIRPKDKDKVVDDDGIEII